VVETAFEELKATVTNPPILMLPNFNLPFVVECDALGRGIGAILMQQQQQPLAFFSQVLEERFLLMSTYENELVLR
jgi:hypothetical protein